MTRRAVFALALCFFLSGLGSLVLEVVWTRQLRLVFGSTTLAASTILVAYMLGLGLGGLLGGRWAGRIRNGIRAYGWIEIAIGLYALAVPAAFAWFPELNRSWLYTLSFWPAALTRFLLALAVLLVPTVLMGATLPILVAAVVRDDPRVGGSTGLLYGLNTLGAVAGVFLATFVFFASFGLTGTTVFGALLDLAIGLFALTVLSRAVRPLTAPPTELAASPPVLEPATVAARASRAQSRVVLLAYGCVGFTALVYEVAWTRAIATVLGSSIYAFATMLGSFLTGIALGSLLVHRRVDALRRPLAWLAAGLAALGVLGLTTTLLLPRLPDMFLRFLQVSGLDPGPIVSSELRLCMLAMLPPTLVLGALFPLLTRIVGEGAHDAGNAVGRVYFANTLGSASGAFCAGFILIPQLGLSTTLALAAAINFITTAAVLLFVPRRRATGFALATVPALGAVVLLLLPPSMDPTPFTRGVYNRPGSNIKYGGPKQPLEGVPGDEMLYYRDGLNTTVSVHRVEGLLALKVNGKTDASTSLDMSTQVLLGELPLLFGPPARKVLVIGFASGVTVGAVARHAGVERIDAVEIEPAIVEASRFFDRFNGRPLDDPRVRLVLDDGRTYLSGTHEKYDVIISEPSNPWMSGVSNLFTREFFATARGALTEKGRLLQWVHLYAMEPAGLRAIIAALRAEFRYVYGFAYEDQHADLLLLATNAPLTRADLPRWEQLPEAVRSDLRRIGSFSTSDLWSLMALLPENIDALVARAPAVNSDDNLFIELGAPWMLYEDTVEANWKDFASAKRGVVPLLEAVGEPLDAQALGTLAFSYADVRGATGVATEILRESTQSGRAGATIAAAVVVGRRMDGGRGSFTLDNQIASLDDAVSLAPSSLPIRLLRAELELEAGRNGAALADTDAARALDADDPRVRALRGRTLLALDRPAEARSELDPLLEDELAGLDASLVANAVNARRGSGDRAATLALLEDVLHDRSQAWHGGWQLLAEEYDLAGRGEDAERARRNAAAIVKNIAADMRHDARVALWTGSPDQAISLLAEAVRIDPEDEGSRQQLEELTAAHPTVPMPAATLSERSSPSSR